MSIEDLGKFRKKRETKSNMQQAGWKLDAYEPSVETDNWTNLYIWDGNTQLLIQMTVNAADFTRMTKMAKGMMTSEIAMIRGALATGIAALADKATPDNYDTRNEIAMLVSLYAGTTKALGLRESWNHATFCVLLYRFLGDDKASLRPFGWASGERFESSEQVQYNIASVVKGDMERHPDWFGPSAAVLPFGKR